MCARFVISCLFILLIEFNCLHWNGSKVSPSQKQSACIDSCFTQLLPTVNFPVSVTLWLKLQSKFLSWFVWNKWADISNWLYNLVSHLKRQSQISRLELSSEPKCATHAKHIFRYILGHLADTLILSNTQWAEQYIPTLVQLIIVFLVINSSCCVLGLCVFSVLSVCHRHRQTPFTGARAPV